MQLKKNKTRNVRHQYIPTFNHFINRRIAIVVVFGGGGVMFWVNLIMYTY